MEILDAIVDEVALEGLDGISIGALWLRLHARAPPFPLLLDEATKEFIWQTLVFHPELEFYELPVARQPLALVNRYEGTDCDPIVLKAKKGPCFEDIYPVHIVSENKDGIQGSCQFFEERILLTDQLRTHNFTCKQALERWGEKLVIVGSQALRLRALISWEGDPTIVLPDCSYCMLEKLGRSRWQGELQKDLQGSFKVDAGKIHYLRRALDRNGLITMQSHVIKLANGTQQHSLLLLLKRFHIDRRNKYDMLSEKVSALLSESHNQMEALVNLREELGVHERIFKRLYYYMANAGIVKIISLPLQELQPLAERCKTKRGTDIMVRCVKLLKEYKRKVEDSDDDEEDDMRNRIVPVDIICEKDMLTQTYELIENRGTKGISQSEIRKAMNVGKLEARMLCRLLERYMLIKGFMEDEGRQRTTKFISHVFVEESDLRRQFLEEKAKSEKLSMFSLTSVQKVGENSTAAEDNTFLEEETLISEEDIEIKKQKEHEANPLLSQLSICPSKTSTPRVKSKILLQRALSKDGDKSSVLSENECSQDSFQLESNVSTISAHSEDEDDVSVIEEIPDKKEKIYKGRRSSKQGVSERSHETYRLLKRRNIIVEAIKNLRLVESLFTLQKMIMEHEKLEGVSTKCCKKSILRLVHKLSQEGLLRLYRTTVVQDGISKKVELVVHPSINPNDPLVKSAIEQIRFRISNSTGNRTRSPQGMGNSNKAEADDHSKEGTVTKTHNAPSHHPNSSTKVQHTDEKMGITPLVNYHPVIVPGLGRSLGFLPKMPRLKITHLFLWYIVHGHHMRKLPQEQQATKDAASSHAMGEEPVNAESTVTDDVSCPKDGETPPESQTLNCQEPFVDPTPEQIVETVYVNDSTWMRYVPPSTVHSEYGPGWVLVSDILLCLPLSIFIKIVQVSYKVDNLDDYLNDPVKKHTLIRCLPRPMRQQLLYKRRYVFSVFQGLQKLSCMGLVQFGSTEKFQDKDQIFLYVRKKATIVDTTACDPHYNLAQGSKPFDKRFYTFDTLQEAERFWFDLQFVCLNTPLGVVRIRGKKTNPQAQEESVLDPDNEQEERSNLERKAGILESVPGSREVVDDGSIPGDGLGAGGLDSSFYSHMKRNWIWISYIINKHKMDKESQDIGFTMRLQTFLNKHTLPLGTRGNQTSFWGDKKLVGKDEIVQVLKEAAENRSERVCGGKGRKRKRLKKDTGPNRKAKKKKSNPTKNRRYHDEADQSALQRMTRLRVAWTAQEDGLLMLCRIASNILNKKVKAPFVPWQVVRDIMHSSFEESLDKTSHSIGRRTRYTIKNPQTYLNYKVCLAEVYQDKTLIEDFMSQKKNYNDPKVCAAEYKEFVERLKNKFSSTLGYATFEIPDNVSDLFARYRILAVGDKSDQEGGTEILDSVNDIYVLVVQNLILSTLSLSDVQIKTCRSLQTFRIFRAYSDHILVKAFMEFQNRRLVNRRRGNHMLGPKKHRALPFVPMSYQLSQSYYRLFTWRFPVATCTESFQFLELLKETGYEDRADSFSFGDQDTEETDMLMFPLDGPGGQCATVLALLSLGLVSINVKIPDQIVVVDSTLVDNEVMKSLGKDGLDDEDFEDEYAEDASQKRKIEVKARQASHTNYLLMRGYSAPGIVSTRNLNPNDSVVVNSCQVYLKLRDTSLSNRLRSPGSPGEFTDTGKYLPHNFTGLLNTKKASFDTFLNDCVQCHGYSSRDLSCISEIYSAIEACSFQGIKISDLLNEFCWCEDLDSERTKYLLQYLQDLLTSSQVLEVGGASARLVAMKHAYPWVLHSEVKEPVTQDSEVKKPITQDSEVKEPITQESEVKESVTQESEVKEPVKQESEVKEPVTQESEVKESVTQESEVKEPVKQESEVKELVTQESEVKEPVTQESEVKEPVTQESEVKESVTQESEVKEPVKQESEVKELVKQESEVKELVTQESEVKEPVTQETETFNQYHDCVQSAPPAAQNVPESDETGFEPPMKKICLEDRDHVSQTDFNTSLTCPSTSYKMAENVQFQKQGTDAVETLHERESDCCFLGRPWRIVDGTLNKPVCKGMLEGVLYHIMTKPGITEKSLLQHYSGVLQPVVAMELVQVLEQIGCIKKSYIEKSSKVSLFSPTVIPQVIDKPKIMDDPIIFYEPTIDCTWRLGGIFPSEVNWNKWVL
ncbi:general transcription factor 3C polypeptide 1 isoform X2 [Xenopus laevis]|uniref:General transcription factor 3C polypeptide 1 isoform X2 n=1 Tax=Xenopus laevis TaxID=8355 RepID=A0A8J1LSD3_XENLA|nr:general transcription factor 3C polypeptide 1 isoform X2 [Xenopus laevis]